MKFIKITYRFHKDQPKRLVRLAKLMTKKNKKYISANELLRLIVDTGIREHLSIFGDWSRHYRADKGVWEDTCPHGIGHEKRGVHGCDGCCSEFYKSKKKS